MKFRKSRTRPRPFWPLYEPIRATTLSCDRFGSNCIESPWFVDTRAGLKSLKLRNFPARGHCFATSSKKRCPWRLHMSRGYALMRWLVVFSLLMSWYASWCTCLKCEALLRDVQNTKVLICSGCKCVVYCSRGCQHGDWIDHKQLCRKERLNIDSEFKILQHTPHTES